MKMSIVDIILNQMPVLLVIIGALVALTNIIVEVLKKFTYDKIPTNILAVVVAIVLTLVAFFALMSWAALLVKWYYVAAAIVVAFLVAYAAMFGYDKLKEALLKIQELR
jgi:hypothetical protein